VVSLSFTFKKVHDSARRQENSRNSDPHLSENPLAELLHRQLNTRNNPSSINLSIPRTTNNRSSNNNHHKMQEGAVMAFLEATSLNRGANVKP